MEQEKLIYKINGKEYLLLDEFITSSNGTRELDAKVKKVGGIVQGIKEVKSGFFGGGYGIIRVLIPTDKLEEYQDWLLNREDKMYRCKICKKQSEKGDVMFRKITKKRILDKGWEIKEEKDCCKECYFN